MAFNPHQQNSGGYRQGGGGNWQQGNSYNTNYNNNGGGQRKRGREEDYQNGNNFRRRHNDGGDQFAPRVDDTFASGNGGARAPPSAQKFKDLVWALGSGDRYNPSVDIPSLAKAIENQHLHSPASVFEAFRVAITELPHKLPHYVALISILSRSTVVPPPTAPRAIIIATDAAMVSDGATISDDATVTQATTVIDRPANVGQQILLDMIKAFQLYLDERKWRNVRYCVHLFSCLVVLPRPLLSATSLTVLLSSFSSVLDEPGLRSARGDECVRIIVESLLRLGRDGSSGTEALRDSVQVYLAARKIEKDVFGDAENAGQFEDPIEVLVSTLVSDFPLLVDIIPVVNVDLQSISGDSALSSSVVLDLPVIIVPAEIDEAVSVATEKFTASSTGLRGDEGVGYEGTRIYHKFFDDDSVPATYDPNGTVLRSLIHDIIDLYETNRKECAKILLELPLWVVTGTFKSKSGDEEIDDNRKDWVLENMVVESILGSLFSLPRPHLPLSYYQSLLNELCRLSPQTVAPALGRCVRRLYGGLGTDSESGSPIILCPEGIRRFADWFAQHLSNFGFAWGWSDWVADMSLGEKHPKRVFVARMIELEVRLSYYDRVKGTIPEALYNTGIMADEAPSSEYAYAATDHKYHVASESLLRLIKSKESVPEVESEIASFQQSIREEEGLSEEAAESIARDMAIQTILKVGSMSFSHFLNVVERYMSLLHTLSPSAASRSEVLNTIASFWRRNPQFHLITITKFLHYRLVNSGDVVAWIFSSSSAVDDPQNGWCNIDHWDHLTATIKAIKARVGSAKWRLSELRQIEEKKAVERATDAIEEENSEIPTAVAQLETVEKELTSAVVEIVRHFAELLANHKATDEEDWESWWIEGWFREFCRSVSPSLLTAGVSDEVAKLDLPAESNTALILESAKVWCDFC